MDIGIDLGTTFSVIAVNGRVELMPDYPSGIYLDECDVTIIPTPEGEETFPSVVMQDPDAPETWLFGHAALQRAEEGYAPVMFSKRKIGTREAIPMQTRTVLAKDVAREFLRYLKQCAEQALGGAVERAVVTHPAYFDRGAVEETREAAAAAGFEMVLPEQMLMEPVAAALTYTRTDKRDPLRILTYDLGGGTFDVTFLERRSGVIDVCSFDGDHLLGGYNFDRELAHWVRQRLVAQGRQIVVDEADPADRGRLARLLRLAESVKIALAHADGPTKPVEVRGRGILADVQGKDVQIQERITREQFVALIQPQLDRTVECCRRALQKAGAAETEVNEVLLVGGSTYGPWIKEALSAAFPSATPKLFHPDLCVGAGAAIHAKMVLPPLITQAAYRLLLDAPESSVLAAISVAGRVDTIAGTPLAARLSARLRLPSGETQGPTPLAADGGFLFTEMELPDDQPGRFKLFITDAQGVAVLEHAFQVVYAPEDSETSAVTTVLPKPLYIKTRDGLVPLASEGARLPAKCQGVFARLHDNPNLSIVLYQEREEVGEVRIEGIPPEGGSDALVVLELEVTEKNQIRGNASVRTRAGKIVAHTPVSVHFAVPEIPHAEALRAHCTELRDRWLLVRAEAQDEHERARLETVGGGLLQQIDHLFAQQPLERQEVQVALRQLDNLLTPPEDEMRPTRCEFLFQLEDCRAAIDELSARSESAVREAQRARRPGETEQALLKNAQADLQKAARSRQALLTLERDALAAHARGDRKAWAMLNEGVVAILAQVRERPRVEEWSTRGAKEAFFIETLQTRFDLETRARSLAEKGKLAEWAGAIDRLKHELNAVLAALQKVDDGLPPARGVAQLQLIYRDQLQPIKVRIDELGEHLRTL